MGYRVLEISWWLRQRSVLDLCLHRAFQKNVRIEKQEFLPSCVLSSSGVGVSEGEATLGPIFSLNVVPTDFPSSTKGEARCCEP
jgi:hypothetical protein